VPFRVGLGPAVSADAAAPELAAHDTVEAADRRFRTEIRSASTLGQPGRASMTDSAFHRTAVGPLFRLHNDMKETAPPFGRGYTCASLHETTVLYGSLGEVLSELTLQQTITV